MRQAHRAIPNGSWRLLRASARDPILTPARGRGVFAAAAFAVQFCIHFLQMVVLVTEHIHGPKHKNLVSSYMYSCNFTQFYGADVAAAVFFTASEDLISTQAALGESSMERLADVVVRPRSKQLTIESREHSSRV